MEKLKGLIAAPFTPMDEGGELALNQIDLIAEMYRKNGVKGAFICGSTGEGVSLSHEEKKEVMKAWGKAKGQNLKTVFMLGGTCLKEMQELALLARSYDMDGISIFCPNYFKPSSVKNLVAFCKEVAEADSDLPFYYYHIPSLTHGHFSMREFLEEADEMLPNLAGIKYTAPDLLDFQSCVLFKNGKFNMLWGTDEALLSGLAAGADGAVGSTYNYAAPIYNRIMSAYDRGNLKEARELQLKVVQMVQLLVKYGGTQAGKAFMKLIGVDCGWFRSPLQPLSKEKVEALHEGLQDIGFFEFCNQI